MSALERTCPSDLRLEAHLLDPSASPLGAHVEACARCRARLDEMRREGEEFRQFVYPATVDAVVEAARPRPRFRWALLAPVPIAAAALALFLILPRGPAPDYVGPKGDLGFAVFVATASGARAVEDGERVPANAAVRFQVKAQAPCRLWICSVDATGQVYRLYPPGKGGGGAELEGGTAAALPGGAMLDGKSGPERFYAICAPGPLSWPDAVKVVKAAAGGGEPAVRGPGPLRGLPDGAFAATVLVEKGP